MPPKENQNVDMNRSQSAPPHPGDSSRLSEQVPIPYPNIRGLTKEYPDVDPYGKYCRVDMDHARDMNQLRTYMQLLGEPNKSIVETILNSEGFKELEQKMEPCCQEIWKLRNEGIKEDAPHYQMIWSFKRQGMEMEAKQYWTTWLSKINEKEAKAIELEQYAHQHDAHVRDVQIIMTAMQKMAGVPGDYRRLTLTDQEVDLCNQIVPELEELTTMILTGQNVPHNKPEKLQILPPNKELRLILTGKNVPHNKPEKLQILPPNMESIVQHMLVQEVITELNTIGIPVRTPPMAHMDQKIFEERASQYADSVVRDVLDAIYTYREEDEKRTYKTTERDNKGINRGTRVYANDENILQWMRKEYEAEQRKEQFGESQRVVVQYGDDVVKPVAVDEKKYKRWHEKNLDEMSVKRVRSVLMEGGSVKAYVGLRKECVELKMDGLQRGMGRPAQQDAEQQKAKQRTNQGGGRAMK